jgi:hypothetical protein
VPSGFAHRVCRALIVFVAGCSPLALDELSQLAIGDGGAIVDDSMVALDDAPMEGGPVDAPIEGGGPDAPDAMPDAMIPDAPPDAMVVPDAMEPPDAPPDAMDPPDAMVPDAAIDAAVPDAGVPDSSVPDASVPDSSVPDASVPDAGVPDGGLVDGGPGDGSLSDALNPDAREPPGLPVGGSNDDDIKSFYACSSGDGASALPLLLAILALRRRPFRGSGVT